MRLLLRLLQCFIQTPGRPRCGNHWRKTVRVLLTDENVCDQQPLAPQIINQTSDREGERFPPDPHSHRVFFAQSSLEQVLSQQDCSTFKVEGFMAVLIYPVLTWLSSQEAAW